MNKIHKKEPTAKGKNPYATNRGGFISAPTDPAKGDPAAHSVKGDDLRVKRKVRRGE
jgi:hypothetical protein